LPLSCRVDYHVHLEHGPYAAAWLEEFLQIARQRGLQELGVSEHLCDFYEGQAASGRWWEVEPNAADREHARAWWRGRPRHHLDDYVAFVRGARPEGIALRLGLEADYFPGQEDPLGHLLGAYPWDYILGSVHWLGAWGFDHLSRLESWAGRDVDAVYRRYFALLSQAVRSGLFDVLAHPDLVKIAGYRPSFDLTPLYGETARALARAGVAVEVSTAGLRKPVHEIYPAEPFLRLCREHDVPITLASDAHQPAHVGWEAEAAVALARRCGYTHACRFVRRQREEMPL
jgi:histidinol-phosphatase (PHP family)